MLPRDGTSIPLFIGKSVITYPSFPSSSDIEHSIYIPAPLFTPPTPCFILPLALQKLSFPLFYHTSLELHHVTSAATSEARRTVIVAAAVRRLEEL